MSVGIWAGGGFVALLVAYMAALAVMTARGLPFPPHEPFLTTFHVIMLLAGLTMVPLWAAIHLAAPADRQVYTLISLTFVVLCAVCTCANRFVALTMVRQSPGLGRTAGLDWFQPYGWPSLTFTLELLGWGVFFSLACLFMAPAFQGRGIGAIFTVTGVFSLGGALGLFLDSTAIMGAVAPVAWGIGPAAAVVLVMIRLRSLPLATAAAAG
ncbi:hypothetical protein [Nonomuraea ceibae]|uniref:hypothetical protein n=1 Tax=Nonomuraea ceibae TaxID=1935170 RepID=UPI001C602042|nr:hypothetical protein [Nonomuraea ceibae]